MTYIKTGKITGTKLANGHYEYDDKSVYNFLKKDPRYNAIYVRVSTYKQKSSLVSQVSTLNSFCENKNISNLNF